GSPPDSRGAGRLPRRIGAQARANRIAVVPVAGVAARVADRARVEHGRALLSRRAHWIQESVHMSGQASASLVAYVRSNSRLRIAGPRSTTGTVTSFAPYRRCRSVPEGRVRWATA